MQVRRLIARTVVPLVATAGLVACSSGDSAKVDPAGVVSIQIAEPQHLLPTNTNDSSGVQVIAAPVRAAGRLRRQNQAVRGRRRVDRVQDNKVWTIKLKDGYTFHNGEKVTVDNYIDAWNYGAYGPNGQNNGYFFEKDRRLRRDPDRHGPRRRRPGEGPPPKSKTLTGLKKVDDLTFQVTLSEPFTEFKTMLGYTAFFPLPKAAFSAPGVIKEDYESAPIGQGPFKMKGTWQHDAKIEVERYDAFPGTKPKVGGVEFRIYQQPTAAYADVLSDNLDVIPQIPTESLATATDDLGDRYQRSPASSVPVPGVPDLRPGVREPRSAQGHLDGDRPRRDRPSRSSRVRSSRPARSSRRSSPATGRTPAARPASSTRPRPRRSTQAAGGPTKIDISYNGDGRHKDWVDATCNQLKPTWAWSARRCPRPSSPTC